MADNGRPGLSYYLPEPEKVHTVLRIPGSHTLFVGPSGCTRRHAIHAAEYGDRQHVSFLFITEADVVSGHYEDLMVESVGQLIELLEPSPHIFLLAVFCIDNFLGTDEAALLDQLRTTYPDRQFAIEHIDPVSRDEQLHRVMRKHVNMYGFIKPAARQDNGINFLGHFVSLEPDCEFLALLRAWGCGPIRELFHCQTYEDYQAIGKSRLSVVMRHMGQSSAEYLRDELGIPYYVFVTTYDAKAVAQGYGDIAGLLQQPRPDFTEAVAEVTADAKQTAELLQGLPIALDSSAFLSPFSAAKALLGYGFNVRYIFISNDLYRFDQEAKAHIEQHYPEVAVTWATSYKHLYERIENQRCLAIGADCARLLRARHVVDVWHDEGYFGFHGILRLMQAIREARHETHTWADIPQLQIQGEED